MNIVSTEDAVIVLLFGLFAVFLTGLIVLEIMQKMGRIGYVFTAVLGGVGLGMVIIGVVNLLR